MDLTSRTSLMRRRGAVWAAERRNFQTAMREGRGALKARQKLRFPWFPLHIEPTISPQQARDKAPSACHPGAFSASSPRRLPLDRCNAANAPATLHPCRCNTWVTSQKMSSHALPGSATLWRSFSTLTLISGVRPSTMPNWPISCASSCTFHLIQWIL